MMMKFFLVLAFIVVGTISATFVYAFFGVAPARYLVLLFLAVTIAAAPVIWRIPEPAIRSKFSRDPSEPDAIQILIDRNQDRDA